MSPLTTVVALVSGRLVSEGSIHMTYVSVLQ